MLGCSALYTEPCLGFTGDCGALQAQFAGLELPNAPGIPADYECTQASRGPPIYLARRRSRPGVSGPARRRARKARRAGSGVGRRRAAAAAHSLACGVPPS